MATNNITKDPYELLARWNDRKDEITTPSLKGASIRWLYKSWIDGKLVGTSESDPEGIDIAGQKGFPLTDILNQVNIDALTTINTHEATIATRETELSETSANLATATIQVTNLTAHTEDLVTRIDTLNKNLETVSGRLQDAIDQIAILNKTIEEKDAEIKILSSKEVVTSNAETAIAEIAVEK